MNPLNNLPRKAFYAVPHRESWSSEIECDSLVMLPLGVALHDSGYRFMDAVACKDDELLCRVAGGSDVFHLSEPSNIWTAERTPVHPTSWGMDCLKRSGLFRIWIFDRVIKVGASLSSLSLHPMTRLKP